jgi:CRP-like cAMP-binding protein
MLDTAQIHDILNEIPLFSGCSDEVLDALAAVAERHEFKKGETIYEAGDQAIDMYVLLHGLVSFKTPRGVGHLFVETLMKRHMIFGWASLVPEHPRRLGSATCMEGSTMLVMNGDRIMEILSSEPQAGFLVMKRLCSMIANTFIDKSKAA